MKILPALSWFLLGGIAHAASPGQFVQISQVPTQFFPPTLTNSGQNWTSPSGVTWTVETQNGVNYTPVVAPYAFTVARPGVNVQRFQVKKGDCAWPGGSGLNCAGQHVRSEVDGYGVTNVPLGTDQWMAWSFYLPSGTTVQSDWNIIGQDHDQECSGVSGESPPLAINVGPGNNLTVVYIYNQVNCDPNPQGPNSHVTSATIQNALTRHQWHNIVMQLNVDWSTGGSGKINIWLDGVQKIAYAGPVGYNGASIAGYWKWGYYADGNELAAVYYANMEATCTTQYACGASLASRITSPLPIPPIRVE